MFKQITNSKFAARFNEVVGYEAIVEPHPGEVLLCGRAAAMLCKGLYISHETMEAACCPLGALKKLDLLPESVELENDMPLTEDIAEAWLLRATRAKIIVSEDSAIVDRETVKLSMGATVKRVEGVLYVPIRFGAVALGGCVHGDERPYSVVVNNRSYEDQEKFLLDNGVVYVPLEDICAYFGAERIEKQGRRTVILFDRYALKSNRDLTQAERQQRFTDIYLRYWYTPLPERRDEIAWRTRGHRFGDESNVLPNNSLLHLSEVSKLMDPDYYDLEGWCRFDDGSAVFSVNTPMPGVSTELFSWWFAWHGLADVRYMVWYPPSHYGLWIENALQRGQEPFRAFDESLTMAERSYDLIHHVNESFAFSTNGSDAYYLTKADGTNTNKIRPAGPMGLNFVDLSAPGAFFDTGEYARQSKEGRIASVGMYPPTPRGIAMCHFFRIGKDGVPTLHTHFWFGCTIDRATHKYVVSDQPRQHDFRLHLMAEHCVREFAVLAEVLPQIAAQERGIPLAECADANYYAKGVHPNL